MFKNHSDYSNIHKKTTIRVIESLRIGKSILWFLFGGVVEDFFQFVLFGKCFEDLQNKGNIVVLSSNVLLFSVGSQIVLFNAEHFLLLNQQCNLVQSCVQLLNWTISFQLDCVGEFTCIGLVILGSKGLKFSADLRSLNFEFQNLVLGLF